MQALPNYLFYENKENNENAIFQWKWLIIAIADYLIIHFPVIFAQIFLDIRK